LRFGLWLTALAARGLPLLIAYAAVPDLRFASGRVLMTRAMLAVFARPQLAAPLFLLLSTVAVTSRSGGEELRVSLASGREFAGQVDARTDADRLWLRSEGTAIEVVRPIDWQRITGAKLGGRQLGIAELKQMADQLKSPSTVKALRLRSDEGDDISEDGSQKETRAGQAQTAAVAASPIRSVNFDAQIANWDGDVEPDGLLIHLFPLDGNGGMTPVSGTLWVELIAPRRRKYHEVPHGRGQSIEQIGRWSRTVNPTDFTTRGVTVKLPFQATHPAFDSDVGSHSLVHARLTVPGHGVFEHSIDGVRVRSFSPLRDALQSSTGRRHFAHERTGRAKR